MNLKYATILVFLLVLIEGCKKEKAEEPEAVEEVFPLNIIRTTLDSNYNATATSWLADTSSGYTLRVSSNPGPESINDTILLVYLNKRPVTTRRYTIKSFANYNTGYMAANGIAAVYLSLKGKYYSVDGGYCKVVPAGATTDVSIYYGTVKTVGNVENVISGRARVASYEED